MRSVVRGLRWVKHAVLSLPAIRDVHDEVFFGEFNPDEQQGHEMALADTVRMNAYRAGIARHVKAGDIVVDLGTGTGILAMLAAQQSPKVVYAIDSSNIVFFAERIARTNGFTNIDFRNISSRRLTLNEQVDVVVHEQIGQALFDEGLVEKTLDLKRRLLKASGRIVPGRFEVFLEPATLKDDHRVPFLWNIEFPGISYAPARSASGNAEPELVEQAWYPASRPAIAAFLCDPSPILRFDLNAITDPLEVASRVSASRVIRHAGRLDAFCLYFRVIFDDDVAFDTSPFSPRTHWDSMHVRLESRHYQAGDTLNYSLDMRDRYDFRTWRVDISSSP
jgi:protein arginine N-methyltransferase 1